MSVKWKRKMTLHCHYTQTSLDFNAVRKELANHFSLSFSASWVSNCIVILTDHECPCTRPDFCKFEKSAVEGANPKQMCKPNNINRTKLSSNSQFSKLLPQKGQAKNIPFKGQSFSAVNMCGMGFYSAALAVVLEWRCHHLLLWHGLT